MAHRAPPQKKTPFDHPPTSTHRQSSNEWPTTPAGLEACYLKMFRQFFDAPSVIEVNYENHAPGDYLVPKRLAVEFVIGKSLDGF